MFWQRRTTLERPRSFACRQVSPVELACAFNARAWPVRSSFSLARPRTGWTVLECFRSQADIGKSPLTAGFRVTWEMRKRRVNQQPELSPTRFTTGRSWFSAWWGPQAFLVPRHFQWLEQGSHKHLIIHWIPMFPSNNEMILLRTPATGAFSYPHRDRINQGCAASVYTVLRCFQWLRVIVV